MSAKKKTPPKKRAPRRRRSGTKNYPREIHARFAAWFKETRRKRGETLSEVARTLKVVTAVVSRWEAAKTLPSSHLVGRITRWSQANPAKVINMLDIDEVLDS